MNRQWWKLFTADRLLEAHLLLGFLQMHGIAGFLSEANDVVVDPGEPLRDAGIKVFVPLGDKAKAQSLFQERFLVQEAGPYTGALQNPVQGKSQVSGVLADAAGEELIVWQYGDYDPLVGVDVDAPLKTDPPAETVLRCTHCQAVNKPKARWCETCGENFPSE